MYFIDPKELLRAPFGSMMPRPRFSSSQKQDLNSTKLFIEKEGGDVGTRKHFPSKKKAGTRWNAQALFIEKEGGDVGTRKHFPSKKKAGTLERASTFHRKRRRGRWNAQALFIEKEGRDVGTRKHFSGRGRWNLSKILTYRFTFAIELLDRFTWSSIKKVSCSAHGVTVS
jgi:hypothetical protein